MMISTAKHGLRDSDVVSAEPESAPLFFSFRRSMQLTQRLAVFLVMAGLLVGCDLFGGGDDDPELDEQLETALNDAAQTVHNSNMEAFNLPASDDFASIPQDPNNPVTQAKVTLGQLLYHETGLLNQNKLPQGAGTASCASCHNAAAGFQAGRIQGVGEGGLGFGTRGEARVNDPMYPIDSLDVQPIRSPSAMNGAYQIVNLWNGQFGATGPNTGTQSQWGEGTPIFNNFKGFEGLETQAIAGLTVHRMGNVPESVAATNATYMNLFEQAFPGEAISTDNAGLAIAAYERTLLSNQAPFQRWLDGDKEAMTEAEKRGAIVFFTKARCVDCHNGPALSSMTFYALGMNNLDGPGVYGDGPAAAEGANLGRGGFTGNPDDNYKFKTPQLYNLTDSPFFGHGGNFRSVREVVEYKNAAIAQNSAVPSGQLAAEFQPLDLSDDEISDLVTFIESGLYDNNLDRYVPASLPSGNCLVVADTQSRAQLGC